ncbi:UNVERIFIED_CONTAM: hypothetical protein K2H54_013930, partial [Gekko kuhli]
MADNDTRSVPVTTVEEKLIPVTTVMTTTVGGDTGQLERFWRESYSWMCGPGCTEDSRAITLDPKLLVYSRRYSSRYLEEYGKDYRKVAKSEKTQIKR